MPAKHWRSFLCHRRRLYRKPYMIQTFADLDELSSAAADRFCELAEAKIKKQGIFRVTLSGGSTPKRLYQMLAERTLPWDKVEFYWGDERNVATDDDQSNYRMVREALLDRLPSEQVHAFPVPVSPADPVGTAAAYERTLRRTFPDLQYPAWDLALLGMGDDAHTASLFPGTSAINQTDRWFVDNSVPQLGTTRYTLTAPAINSARVRIFLVSGEKKRNALAKVLSDNEYDPNQYPSQLIESPEFYVTADATAGS